MARPLPTAHTALSPQARSLSDLGLLVRNARALGALRIDDTAHLASVSSDLLSRLENGRPVTTDKLLAVLDTLGLCLMVVPRAQAARVSKHLQADTAGLAEDVHDGLADR